MPSSPGIGMHVEVKDPDDKIVLSRVYSSEGNKTNIFMSNLLILVYFARSHFIHKSHTRWTCDLHVFQLHCLVQWLSASCSPWYSSRGARCWLRKCCAKRETYRTSAQNSSTSRSSRANHKGAKLSALSWRAFPSDQRKHEQTCSLLVTRSNSSSSCNGSLANETS